MCRKIYNFGPTKQECKNRLTEELKGVQHVPSLLLHQDIASLNLKNYTILECEPLHDIKGHLQNIFDALPNILEKELAEQCKDLLNINLLQKNTKRGSDCRLTAIHLLLPLIREPAPEGIVTHYSGAVICQQVCTIHLKLYNSTFLHHELCTELFEGNTQISHCKLFGSHMHAIVVHSPIQNEIMCLSSCNTECEERLFGQANSIGQETMNRQPNTIKQSSYEVQLIPVH